MITLDKAFAKILIHYPFYASLLLQLKLVEDKTCETMWVDGVSLGYNPDFVKSISSEDNLDQLIGVILHEVYHVVLLHMTRMGNRNPDQWNEACDYLVNLHLKDNNITLPKDALLNENYRGLSEDAIYNLIKREERREKRAGEVRPAPVGKEGLEEDWVIKIVEAATYAKKQGKLPKGIDRYVEELTESKIDPREVLSRFIGNTCKEDYNWSRPNRRYLPLYLPQNKSDWYLKITFAVDTSGSMENTHINQALALVTSCLEVYSSVEDIEVPVIYCDTEVHVEIKKAGEEFRPKGGGGTLYSPVFEYIDKELPECRGVIYYTDGYCDDFSYVPNIPVLWLLSEKNPEFKPPFGEVLVLGG